ncbi:MAG: tyrosine--tRNA ligase, partial [Candidatus Eisenbacteria bacterium]
MLSPERQHEILLRGTEEILPEGALLERLRLAARERRPLRVKQGFDPTAPDIHLGHTVGLRKLRAFQDLGHQVVLIVGDYTGMVGDPSGRSKTRPQLTEAEVEVNARTYLEQFYQVLDPRPTAPLLPVEVHHNGEWFAPMRFMDVLRLAGRYTVSQLLERDDFAKRYSAGQPIGVHELMYPLMQGQDSVEIRADVELGATEQKFNLIVGRELQRLAGQPPQVVLTLPVLPGLDGVQRMSKSLGNYIGVTDAPSDMFGKVMRLPDWVMPKFWALVADVTDQEKREIERDLDLLEGLLDRPIPAETTFLSMSPKVNPMIVKKRLGERIVTMYHGAAAAAQARADFETQFSRREVPEHLEDFHE